MTRDDLPQEAWLTFSNFGISISTLSVVNRSSQNIVSNSHVFGPSRSVDLLVRNIQREAESAEAAKTAPVSVAPEKKK